LFGLLLSCVVKLSGSRNYLTVFDAANKETGVQLRVHLGQHRKKSAVACYERIQDDTCRTTKYVYE
jgi:hypothetical protein